MTAVLRDLNALSVQHGGTRARAHQRRAGGHAPRRAARAAGAGGARLGAQDGRGRLVHHRRGQDGDGAPRRRRPTRRVPDGSRTGDPVDRGRHGRGVRAPRRVPGAAPHVADERRHQPRHPAGHRPRLFRHREHRLAAPGAGGGAHRRADGVARRSAEPHAAGEGGRGDRPGLSRALQPGRDPDLALRGERAPGRGRRAAGRAGVRALQPAGDRRHGPGAAHALADGHRPAAERRLHPGVLQGVEADDVRCGAGRRAGVRARRHPLPVHDAGERDGGGGVRCSRLRAGRRADDRAAGVAPTC